MICDEKYVQSLEARTADLETIWKSRIVQREWVGLTWDEVCELQEKKQSKFFLICDVEKKLWEKNQVKYEEAIQIAIEELDEKIQCLSDTFNGHSARIERYIHDLSMARKSLRQALEQPKRSHEEFLQDLDDWARPDTREWVGLTPVELMDLCAKSYYTDNAGEARFNRGFFADAIEAKLKEKNHET